MINKVILVGNLGRDPEVHTTQSGSVVTQLSLATSRRVKQADGSYGDEVEWHRVVFFGRLAEVCRDYVRKGKQIYVEGRLRTRKYTKDGSDQYITEIIGLSLQLLGRQDDGASGEQRKDSYQTRQPQSEPSGAYDEVPF